MSGYKSVITVLFSIGMFFSRENAIDDSMEQKVMKIIILVVLGLSSCIFSSMVSLVSAYLMFLVFIIITTSIMEQILFSFL